MLEVFCCFFFFFLLGFDSHFNHKDEVSVSVTDCLVLKVAIIWYQLFVPTTEIFNLVEMFSGLAVSTNLKFFSKSVKPSGWKVSFSTISSIWAHGTTVFTIDIIYYNYSIIIIIIILIKNSSHMCLNTRDSIITKWLYLRNSKEHNQVFGIYELTTNWISLTHSSSTAYLGSGRGGNSSPKDINTYAV